MPLVATEAIIVHAFRYGETSKIVRLLTREHGVQSVMAKGAYSPKSRFGGKLQFLSQGIARFYLKTNRDLHTLQEFDVGAQWPELGLDVRRFAAGSALSELVLRFAPSAPHPEIFEVVTQGLATLAHAPQSQLDVHALAAMWTTVGVLGFEPSVAQCARDGAPLAEGAARFSVRDGGFLCATCARGTRVRTLEALDRAHLECLITGRPDGITALTPSQAAAHRRLLAQFVERHVAEGRELRALSIWQEIA